MNIIVIDDSHISSTGTISIYTDIILIGDTTISTTKCISAFNNSQVIIDLTKRSKEETEVLAYNCLTVPDLDVELRGSYADGCVPRYEVQQTSLVLVFDTESCQDSVDNTGLIIGVISGIVALCIVIGIILVLLLSHDSICKSLKNDKNAYTSAGLEKI